jgi:5-methylcytosine-specific restriction endonuclease McrA
MIVPQTVLQAVLARDGHRCTECPNTTRLDVVYLREARYGGTDEPANLVTLCDRCRD